MLARDWRGAHAGAPPPAGWRHACVPHQHARGGPKHVYAPAQCQQGGGPAWPHPGAAREPLRNRGNPLMNWACPAARGLAPALRHAPACLRKAVVYVVLSCQVRVSCFTTAAALSTHWLQHGAPPACEKGLSGRRGPPDPSWWAPKSRRRASVQCCWHRLWFARLGE